jgi:hypothetical protein
MGTKRRRIAAWCACAQAFILAACSHSDHPGLDVPADRWTNIPPEAVRGQVAIVAARDGDATLTASCYYGASITLFSTAKLKEPSQARNLSLGFDGAVPVPQTWVSRNYASPRWGFETGSRRTDFMASFDALRQHREVEAVVTEAEKEVLRVHFSLAGAEEALAHAFQNCPPGT